MTVNDLVPLQVAGVAPPPSAANMSVPGLMASLGAEWDALVLETFNLRQALDQTRQQLSQTLYQHDAACRVIARLLRERDEARAMLAQVGAPVAAPQQQQQSVAAGAAMDTSDSSSSSSSAAPSSTNGSAVDIISSHAQILSSGRKNRKIPAELVTKEAISAGGFTERTSLTPHSASKQQQGVTALAGSVSRGLVVTGGVDKDVIVSSLGAGGKLAVSQKLKDHSKRVTAVAVSAASGRGLIASAALDNEVKVWSAASDGSEFSLAASFSHHSSPASAVLCHPAAEHLLISLASDASWAFVDLNNHATPVMLVGSEDTDGSGSYTCGALHPDGLILAGGTAGGVTKLWDIRERKNVANLCSATGENLVAAGAAVGCVSFSENGYYLSSGDQAGVVDLWDLRKLKSVKKFELGAAVHTCAFDVSGSYLACGGAEGQVVVQAVKDWAALTRVQAHSKAVTGLFWADNFANQLVSSSLDRSVKLFMSVV